MDGEKRFKSLSAAWNMIFFNCEANCRNVFLYCSCAALLSS